MGSWNPGRREAAATEFGVSLEYRDIFSFLFSVCANFKSFFNFWDYETVKAPFGRQEFTRFCWSDGSTCVS